MINKTLALFALILCSGCSKAEITDARMRYLMAHDHGWIDLTIKAAPPSQIDGRSECAVAFSVNGETMLQESANYAAASEKGNPIGYQFPAPSGDLDATIVYSQCVKESFTIKQAFHLPKDHLATLTLDGPKVAVDETRAYVPVSLDSVRTQLDAMRTEANKTDHRLEGINALVLGCLGLNAVGLLLLLWRRKRAP